MDVELKDGRKYRVEFGAIAPSGFPYAATVLDSQTWIFQFPPILYYKYVEPFLVIPEQPH